MTRVRKILHWSEIPFNPKLKIYAKKLRRAGNLAEVLFWNQVKRKQFLGLDFDRQKIIGNYIVDFYCKQRGVVIEIDGSSHDNKAEYDRKRDDFFLGLGLAVIHFTDRQIKQELEGVMKRLEEFLTSFDV